MTTIAAPHLLYAYDMEYCKHIYSRRCLHGRQPNVGAALKIRAQHGSDAWVRYNRLLYAIRYAGYGLFALGVIAYITYGE